MHGVRCAAALLFLTLAASPAVAAIRSTSPIEDVLPQASHVVRVKLPMGPDGTCEVLRTYRGELPPGPLRIHRLPGPVYFSVMLGAPHRGGLGAEHGKPVSLIVALYEMDGRYHVVGRRPPNQIPPHSSVWMIDDADRVYGYRQVINPGGPVAVSTRPRGRIAFEKRLTELLKEHSFRGPTHVPVPAAERDRFRALIEPAIDWYARRTARAELSSEERVKLGRALVAYAADAPPSMAVHVFDALQLLGGHQRPRAPPREGAHRADGEAHEAPRPRAVREPHPA
jgi:hypothetical protein